MTIRTGTRLRTTGSSMKGLSRRTAKTDRGSCTYRMERSSRATSEMTWSGVMES